MEPEICNALPQSDVSDRSDDYGLGSVWILCFASKVATEPPVPHLDEIIHDELTVLVTTVLGCRSRRAVETTPSHR